MTTTALEQKLYEREVNFLNAEIVKGFKIIQNAFAKYKIGIGHDHPSFSKEDLAAFLFYMESLKCASSVYYAGDHLRLIAPVVETKPPEYVKKIITAYACDQFIKQVETLSEVTSNLTDEVLRVSNENRS